MVAVLAKPFRAYCWSLHGNEGEMLFFTFALPWASRAGARCSSRVAIHHACALYVHSHGRLAPVESIAL